MLSVELHSIEEFEDLNLPSNKEVLLKLRELYPNDYQNALTEFKEFHKYIFTEDFPNLIELTDEINTNDIIINYFVRDSVGTDRGTHTFISLNGYKIIKT